MKLNNNIKKFTLTGSLPPIRYSDSLVNHFMLYPSPNNINYFWGGGSLSAFCLVIQIISGIFLANYYVPHTDQAFLSVEYIMRDVRLGYFMRYLH